MFIISQPIDDNAPGPDVMVVHWPKEGGIGKVDLYQVKNMERGSVNAEHVSNSLFVRQDNLPTEIQSGGFGAVLNDVLDTSNNEAKRLVYSHFYGLVLEAAWGVQISGRFFQTRLSQNEMENTCNPQQPLARFDSVNYHTLSSEFLEPTLSASWPKKPSRT